MEISNLTQTEMNKVVNAFSQMRTHLSPFMQEQKFLMSNAQLFAFIMYAPFCMAIAGDKEIDEAEIKMLEKISKNIDVNQAVKLDLMEVISMIPEPQDVIFNEEFNMRVDAELLELARNMEKYESAVISACKALLSIDTDPTTETSVTKTFGTWFDFVLKNSVSHRKEDELKQIKNYKSKLGI